MAVCTCETFGVCAACAPDRDRHRPAAPAECPHPSEYLHPDARRRIRCVRCGAIIAKEARP